MCSIDLAHLNDKKGRRKLSLFCLARFIVSVLCVYLRLSTTTTKRIRKLTYQSLNLKILLHILFIIALASKGFAQSPPDNGAQINSLELATAVESSLKIYPNPAKSSLTINLKLPAVNQAKLSLHDMLGNEVELLADNVSGAFERTFDIKSVRAGIYFVRINYNNGQNTIVRKIIVQ